MRTDLTQFDVVVIGSGFSGSILAWVLASQGRSVALIDRTSHPRFAIGESSTPTADFLVAHIADRWGLTELAPLACWGTWKSRYPEVICGKKRGFSYYRHYLDQVFQDDTQHSNSLLVAASSSDAWSDTHWLRSSVDQFLAQRSQAAGAALMEGWSLHAASFDRFDHEWTIQVCPVGVEQAEDDGARITVKCRWLVDASGSGNALSEFVENPSNDDWMRTRTGAIFSHYQGVKPFEASRSDDDPFCGDDAAQHHILDSGWCWMLRMDNGVTSVGLVEPSVHQSRSFEETIARYPSVAQLLSNAQRIAPPGSHGRAVRLSRCRDQAVGPGWILLPVTYGFVDPLHSSGIAHALSGIVRVAEALLADNAVCEQLLYQYNRNVRREIEWLDALVSGCYAAQPSFDRFVAFASYYFIAAILFEQQMAAEPGRWPQGFLQSADASLWEAVEQSHSQLKEIDATSTQATLQFVTAVKHRIAPWNHVGLLDPTTRHRIPHAAAPKYASIAAGVA
jgi:tetracycline 7-halogenase / FADH2 O2-dependent halogenase